MPAMVRKKASALSGGCREMSTTKTVSLRPFQKVCGALGVMQTGSAAAALPASIAPSLPLRTQAQEPSLGRECLVISDACCRVVAPALGASWSCQVDVMNAALELPRCAPATAQSEQKSDPILFLPLPR